MGVVDVAVSTTNAFTSIWNTADGDGPTAPRPTRIVDFWYAMQHATHFKFKNEHIVSKNNDFKK
jgi:hypothetical protein